LYTFSLTYDAKIRVQSFSGESVSLLPLAVIMIKMYTWWKYSIYFRCESSCSLGIGVFV